MQAQLQEQGIEIGRLQKTFNENFSIECNIEEYRHFFQDIDTQQMCSRYIWENLPPELTSWQIEHMLYFKGSLAGYMRGGILYLLPYAMTDGINIYGMPNAIQPISYNGVETGNNLELKLPVANNGIPNPSGGAVILYDRIPSFSQGNPPLSRFILNQQLIKLEADIMGRIENNLAAASLKLVFECENEKQARQRDKDIKMNLQSGKPYIILQKDSMSERDGTAYQEGIKLETQSYIELLQSIISLKCGGGGIRNGGAFEKKERAINAEMESDSIQSDIIGESGLLMRKLWLYQMQQQYREADKLKRINVVYAAATRRAHELVDKQIVTAGGMTQA